MSMKKAVFLVATVCMLFLCCYTRDAIADPVPQKNKPLLSEMSKQELYLFLLDNGVHFPVDGIPRENSDDMSSIYAYVRTIEGNPTAPNSFNYHEAALQFEEIRTAVIRYYGWDESRLDLIQGSRYTLVYSTLLDDTENFLQNCYGYVLSIPDESPWPGYFSNGNYDHTAGIASMAAQVKNDLKIGFGYNCVKISTLNPGNTYAMAMRKQTTDNYGFNDFHFSAWMGNGWNHKPGETAVLKFINAPANNIPWTDECYYDGAAHAPTLTYDSDLRFIQNRLSHSNTYTEYTGANYHSGSYHYWQLAHKCSFCDDVLSYSWQKIPCSGPPCYPPFDDSFQSGIDERR